MPGDEGSARFLDMNKDGFMWVRMILVAAAIASWFLMPWPVTATLAFIWVIAMAWPTKPRPVS